MDINQTDFDRIAEIIRKDDSPVGIDAKKTHVLILERLERMQRQLDRVEKLVHDISENRS